MINSQSFDEPTTLLTLTHIAHTNQSPQDVGAVVTVCRFVESFLHKEMAVADLFFIVCRYTVRVRVRVAVFLGHSWVFDAQWAYQLLLLLGSCRSPRAPTLAPRRQFDCSPSAGLFAILGTH